MARFRPWQGGLVEEWGVAALWDAVGPRGYLENQLPMWTGRPLSPLISWAGLAISGGGLIGLYLVLALFGVFQLLAAWWAMRPLVQSLWLRYGLALAIALAPWWAAGMIIRFITAQFSVLAAIVWFGAAVRFLRGPSRRWAPLVVIAPVAGLMAYQAPALPMLVSSVVLAVTLGHGGTRRALGLVALTIGSVAVAVAWTMFIAPLITAEPYEMGVAMRPTLRDVVTTLGRNLLHRLPGLVAIGLVLAVAVVVVWRRRQVSGWGAVILLAGLVAAPFSALVFAVQIYWLGDPERVAIPVGLALWFVACSIAGALPATVRWRAPATVIVIGTLAATLNSYSTWTHYTTLQQGLLNSVAAVRDDIPDGSGIVVKDLSGEFGAMYTLLPPYLDVVLNWREGPGAHAELCTPAAVPREPGVATPTCETLLADADTTDEGTVKVEGRRLQLVAITPPPPPVVTPQGEGIIPESDGFTQRWWWVQRQPVAFDVQPAEGQPFTVVRGELRAAECAATTVTLRLRAEGAEVSTEVALDAAGTAPFELTLGAATSAATLTVEPSATTPGCTVDGDSRERTVALMNPDVG